MSTHPIRRRARTLILSGTAMAMIATVSGPALHAALAENPTQPVAANALHLDADGSFAPIIAAAKPAVVTVTTRLSPDRLNQASMPGGMPDGMPRSGRPRRRHSVRRLLPPVLR